MWRCVRLRVIKFRLGIIYKGLSVSLVSLRGLALLRGLGLVLTNRIFFFEWQVIRFGGIEVAIRVMLDWVRAFFLGVVFFISSQILSYCEYYIEGEKNYSRFVFILLFFVGSIGLLIIRPNLIRVLLGWDGLGITSYVLVIYYQRDRAGNSGILTILSNRLGDVAILISISLMACKGA